MTAAGTVPTFAHLRALITDRGVWQHASEATPDRAHGYCLDDAARAAIVTSRLAWWDRSWRAPLRSCVRFIDAALVPGVGAHNLMDAGGRWLDVPHAGDHVGRTSWALGVLTGDEEAAVASWAAARFEPTVADIGGGGSWLHPVVYSLLGAAAADRPADVADVACRQLDAVAGAVPVEGEWWWPEPRLRYDAGRVPEALLRAGHVFGHARALAAGLRALHWLTRIVAPGDRPHRYPGHLGMAPGDDVDDTGDEQPLEAAAFAGAHAAAAELGAGPHHAEHVRRALDWFHGANRLGVPLADGRTGGCHDGLGALARNRNQGAESTIAYVDTWLTARGAAVGRACGRPGRDR